ncbi:hypothetical protein [Streptomyces sp. NPDC056405]|uniref:hypothetical protein n=1 Tax=Streptomyces sp. NPDC056405 TaxID=3345811 RepID=UPI0035DC7372
MHFSDDVPESERLRPLRGVRTRFRAEVIDPHDLLQNRLRDLTDACRASIQAT